MTENLGGSDVDEPPELDDKPIWTEVSAYNLAVKLLARRDHSCAEISRKLRSRLVSSELIDNVIHSLVERNYLNDKQYAVEYCRQRVAKGYGPLAITAKLKEREVSDLFVNQALQNLDLTWEELAARSIVSRFTPEQINNTDKKQLAKISRYLQSRGFGGADSYRGLFLARKMLSER